MCGLVPVPFTAKDLHRVENFECGKLDYQWPLATWIKEKSVAALEGSTQIWLYENDDHAVVGFGSVGTTKWTLTEGKVKLVVIPALAVQEIFQRKGFSYQIIRHLIPEAVARQKRSPVIRPKLGLFVHPDNAVAMKLYSNIGFQVVPDVSFPDPVTGADCPAMIYDLTKETS